MFNFCATFALNNAQ